MRIKRTIALFGGSFNPAHEGHVHVSCEALKRLGVDEVWWLVSPANPLKEVSSYAEYELRLEHARFITRHIPAIRVVDIEAKLGIHYTIDVIRYLQSRYPDTHFTWVMGADNLVSFHRWQGWREILARVPVVVFNRSPFAYRALHAKAALYARSIGSPITFVFMRLHAASATELRKKLGKNAFLCHKEITIPNNNSPFGIARRDYGGGD